MSAPRNLRRDPSPEPSDKGNAGDLNERAFFLQIGGSLIFSESLLSGPNFPECRFRADAL